MCVSADTSLVCHHHHLEFVCVCVFMLWRGCEKEGRVKELEVDLSLHNYVGVVVYGLL